MTKRIACIMAFLVLGLSVPVLAAEPENGAVEGRIINGTEGGSSVASLEVTLKTYLNDAEAGSATATTDAEGNFVFDGLATGPTYSYEVNLTYQEAEYIGKRVSFGAGETSKSTEMTVYDSTTDDAAIKVAQAHTVVYVEAGSLEIIEYYLIANESDRTYIGTGEITAVGRRKTMELPLPGGATELQYSGSLMECCVVNSDGGFADTMAIVPGMKELLYSYRVSYKSGTYSLSRSMSYPTLSYDVIVQGDATGVVSDQMTAAEPVNIEGTFFSRLSGKDLARGAAVNIRLSNLPDAPKEGAVLPWLVVALAVLGGGFAFVYRTKRRPQPARAVSRPGRARQELLVELAQLDDDFEGGKIQEDVYRRLRTEKKAQLVEQVRRSRKGRK
ncbi:MAG: hypothetical protein HY530_03460 [Chloroflexi bacterium]|nr:hypothetical protein [Chloroflexota bacterium]